MRIFHVYFILFLFINVGLSSPKVFTSRVPLFPKNGHGILLNHHGSQKSPRRTQSPDESPDESGPFEACPFSDLYMLNMDCGFVAPLSEVASCVSSVRLEQQNALQYLTSLYNMTRDFYVFLDIAVDATASVPKNTPFNYPIYNGTDSGQVDVLKEMDSLIDRVEREGASLDVVFEVNEIYNRLRDGHVLINNYVFGEDVIRPLNVLLAEEFIIDDAEETTVRVVSEKAGEFALAVDVVYIKGITETKMIKTIDGMEPLAFFTKLASEPLGMTPFKSVGPRVQNLLHVLFYTNRLHESVASFADISGPNPTKYWKDKYDIVYEDGSSSSWSLFRQIPCAVQLGLLKPELEEVFNEPGPLYPTVRDASKAADLSIYSQDIMYRAPADDVPHRPHGSDPIVNFTMFLNQSSGALGFQVFEDYAVLKVDSFLFESEGIDGIYDAWSALAEAALNRNVTRLIIDLSSNPGGVVYLGQLLAILLYPDATWFDFGNPTDIIMNQLMETYAVSLEPALDALLGEMNITDIIRVTDMLNEDEGHLIDRMGLAVDLFERMAGLVANMSLLDENYVVVEQALTVAQLLNSTVSSRSPPQIDAIETILLLQHIGNVYSLSWDDAFKIPDQTVFQFDFGGARSFTRGGVTRNYSAPFTFLQPSVQTLHQIFARDTPNPFTEYILLSDGTCASTCSRFHSMVSFYSKANSDSAIPLRTVTYGGNGIPEDCPLSQSPGGSEESVPLESMHVSGLNMHILSEVFQEAFPELEDKVREFVHQIPEPCYFCWALPHLPSMEGYSVLTGSDGIPLEYVNIRTDHYIPRWFFETSFASKGDLPELYKLASQFFESPVTAETTEPSPEAAQNELWHCRDRFDGRAAHDHYSPIIDTLGWSL